MITFTIEDYRRFNNELLTQEFTRRGYRFTCFLSPGGMQLDLIMVQRAGRIVGRVSRKRALRWMFRRDRRLDRLHVSGIKLSDCPHCKVQPRHSVNYAGEHEYRCAECFDPGDDDGVGQCWVHGSGPTRVLAARNWEWSVGDHADSLEVAA